MLPHLVADIVLAEYMTSTATTSLITSAHLTTHADILGLGYRVRICLKLLSHFFFIFLSTSQESDQRLVEEQLLAPNGGAYAALEFDPSILFGSQYITDFPLARDIVSCNSSVALFGSLFAAISSQKHRLQVGLVEPYFNLCFGVD